MLRHLILAAVLLTLPAKAQTKNILLLVSDDLRANTLACYGDTICKTPNIDKLAARGMLFEHAYCQGTWCAPSRTSFMRSRYEDKKNVTLGQHLRSHGLHSARAGKIFHMRVPGDIIDGTDGNDIPECWDEKHNSSGQEAHTPGDYACLNKNIFTTALENRQSTRMPHRMFVTVSHPGDGSDQPDHKTATKTIELLQKHKDKPFFIAAGFVRPHYPMVAPEKFFKPYPWEKMILPPQIKNDLADIPKIAIHKSRSAINGIDQFPDNQKRMWSGYYATVTFMDQQVGRVIDELDRLGLSDTTTIIFTSDHGYHLGDHTFWQKLDLHEQVTRVPLIIAAPGQKPGRTKSIVELVDLYPTVTDLLNLPTPKAAQGKSLLPILKDPTAEVKTAALSFAKGTSVRTKNWAYMHYKNGTEELYNMHKDPHQLTNLASLPEHQEIKKNLAAQLYEGATTP